MDTVMRAALAGQFGAAMDTLREAIRDCPDTFWDDRSEGAPFWQIAYHTLYRPRHVFVRSLKSFTPARHPCRGTASSLLATIRGSIRRAPSPTGLRLQQSQDKDLVAIGGAATPAFSFEENVDDVRNARKGRAGGTFPLSSTDVAATWTWVWRSTPAGELTHRGRGRGESSLRRRNYAESETRD